MQFELALSLFCLFFLISKKKTQAYRPSEMVNITVYYETLCPSSRRQIWKAFQQVGPIMDIKLVPYGNALQKYDKETNSWKFNCQHGNDECWGNLFQECAIYKYPRKEDHLPLIYCMLSYNINIQDAAKLCSSKNNIDTNPIEQCMATSIGNERMHILADLTEKNMRGGTPWSTVNNLPSSAFQNRVGENLSDLVCSLYKGAKKPYGCYKFYRL